MCTSTNQTFDYWITSFKLCQRILGVCPSFPQEIRRLQQFTKMMREIQCTCISLVGCQRITQDGSKLRKVCKTANDDFLTGRWDKSCRGKMSVRMVQLRLLKWRLPFYTQRPGCHFSPGILTRQRYKLSSFMELFTNTCSVTPFKQMVRAPVHFL